MPNRKINSSSKPFSNSQCIFLKDRYNFIKILLFAIILLALIYYTKREDLLRFKETEVKKIKYLISNEGCQIIEPLPTLSKFKNWSKNCFFKNNSKRLVSSDEDSIWVNEDAIKSIGKERNHKVICCYCDIDLPMDSRGCYGQYRYNKTCTPFWNKTKVTVEFLKVYCIEENNVIYMDFHLFVPPKRDVDIRCEALKNTSEKLNILILALHSISRSQFHRTMNKTAEYLLKNLSAIEMIGYNKVISHSYPNFLEATSGRYSQELKDTCSQIRNSYLDTCQFIWDDYKLSGYRTALGEDLPYSFTLRPFKPGFCKPPTDYYPSQFFQAAITDNYKEHLEKYCYGIRLRHETFLTYVDRFVRSSKKYPYFGLFFQASFTHIDFDNGYLIDEAYYTYLTKLSQYETFNNTVLIIISDQGYKVFDGPILKKSRQMDSKLPLLSFVFPRWFRRKYSTAIRNLKDNTHSLTSPFDFYETLKDLVGYPEKLVDPILEIRSRNLSKNPLPRGISLFLRIPKRRTCEDGGIPWHDCACVENIDNLTPAVLKWCDLAVNYINSKIDPYSQCARVKLSKVLDAVVSKSVIRRAHMNDSFGQTVIFETIPGPAVFRATLFSVDNQYTEGENNSFGFIDSVSRIDEHELPNDCVTEDVVQSFCYCRRN